MHQAKQLEEHHRQKEHCGDQTSLSGLGKHRRAASSSDTWWETLLLSLVGLDSFLSLAQNGGLPFLIGASSSLPDLGTQTPLPEEGHIVLGELQVQLPRIPLHANEISPQP